MHGNVIKNMDVVFLFQRILKGISQSNWYLLVLDGHGSHVMLKVIKQT